MLLLYHSHRKNGLQDRMTNICLKCHGGATVRMHPRNLTRIEITEKEVAKFENDVSCRFNSGLYPRASSVASSSASVSLARLARERNWVRNKGLLF